VPRFIRFIRGKKYAEAVAVIRESVPFAAVCSLICEHPCEAEGACRRGDLDQPVAIRALERFAVERSGKYEPSEGSKAEPSGKKIAIVGSGPAGFTAAYYLAKKGGHAVTVFESLTQPGGMMREIPEYILPSDILDAEIEGLLKLGIKIKTQSKVESLDKLFENGFDAVFLANGVTTEITDTFGAEVRKKSSRKGVFTGVNTMTGKASFIEAVAAGRKAAISINKYLGGSGNISEILAPVTEGVPRVGRIEGFAQRRRQEMPATKPAKQVGNATEVELGFSDELGQEEAKRCMGCDLRFKVARMVAGPEGRALKTLVPS
jgi:NADPH-dependent glutamate synthase beta subunit-like oxidoreductase